MTGPKRHRQESEEGFTVTELLVVLIVFGILSTVVMIAMTNMLGIVNQTSATYTGVDQVLNLSTTLENLVRSEVEPGPPAPTTPYPKPFPGFAVNGQPPCTPGPCMTASSMTFYSDIGNPNGPALVVAARSATANACSGKCPIPTYSFTVTESAPTAGTCPTTANNLLHPGTLLTCNYSSSIPKRVVSINNVANPSPQFPQPIFTYTILNAGKPVLTNPTLFSSCTPSVNLAVTCPSDTIQSVAFSFTIAAQGAPNTAEYDTTAYRLSSASYEYSPGVG